jgi:hypothetical protein
MRSIRAGNLSERIIVPRVASPTMFALLNRIETVRISVTVDIRESSRNLGMSTRNTLNSSQGDLLLLKEFLPHLGYTKKEEKTILEMASWGGIAVETCFEQAISAVSGVKRSLKNGEDFVNGWEAKKAVASVNDAKVLSRAANIGNIEHKNGIILVAVADPLVNKVYFFRIPQKEVIKKRRIQNMGKWRGSLKIMFSKYGGPPDFRGKNSFSYRAWNEYQVRNFFELCKF